MSTLDRETWTYRSDLHSGDIDLVGYDVEALDGGIGKVDDATYDAGASYIVVDTGPWIFGKKVMLPASVIDRIEPTDDKVFVNRTKDEIKNAPEFDQDRSTTPTCPTSARTTALAVPGTATVATRSGAGPHLFKGSRPHGSAPRERGFAGPFAWR